MGLKVTAASGWGLECSVGALGEWWGKGLSHGEGVGWGRGLSPDGHSPVLLPLSCTLASDFRDGWMKFLSMVGLDWPDGRRPGYWQQPANIISVNPCLCSQRSWDEICFNLESCSFREGQKPSEGMSGWSGNEGDGES